MAIQKTAEFHCLKCDKKFKAGEWECYPGEKHLVEEKTYYIANACADITDRAKSRLSVYVTPEKTLKTEHGEVYTEPARSVLFIGGTYTTNDAEEQKFLDRYEGQITKAQWEEMYIHPKERQAMKARELEARSKALEEQENALKERAAALKAQEEKLPAKGK